ncbi:phosphodiester glycosidase family protein [Rubritalea tangerina]|uniref:Phosphodiester glycosidase family protein n=2 Tax=Rubritalea tangerina TaxID=430798 RepID=A0ABW4ZA55_9BACT
MKHPTSRPYSPPRENHSRKRLERLLPSTALICCALATETLAAPRAISVGQETSPKPPSYTLVTSEGVRLHLIHFDSRLHQLSVIDQVQGPASQWRDSKHLGSHKNAIACLNGGFFQKNGQPLGLVISNGQRRGANHSSSLASGFVFSTAHHIGMARRASLSETLRTHRPKNLLQTGPMLSYQGESVQGLSSKEWRPRSFLATDGSYRWLMGYAENTTLQQLGVALTGKNLAGVPIYHAINLDGGRSSDLWVSPQLTQGGKHLRAFWNKPVRNFLLLTTK